jgi:hypothetical protein
MKTKALAVLCLLLVVLFIDLVPAQAGDGYEKYIEWYSDASKTEVVGWRHMYCNGGMESEGYQTSYRETWFLEECVENWGSGWTGSPCNYQPPGYYCPASCSYCV